MPRVGQARTCFLWSPGEGGAVAAGDSPLPQELQSVQLEERRQGPRGCLLFGWRVWGRSDCLDTWAWSSVSIPPVEGVDGGSSCWLTLGAELLSH